MNDCGWLIEVNAQGEEREWPPVPTWVGIDMDKQGRSFFYTTASHDAIRFARKVDAEQFIAFLVYWGFPGAVHGKLVATEHRWDSGI